MVEADVPSVTGSSVVAVCHWLDQQGLDSREMARQLDLDLDRLSQQDSRAPLEGFNLLLQMAAQELQDPGLGLRLGSWSDNRKMGVIGHIVFNNRTLRQGLEQYQRLASLVNEGIQVQFEVRPELACVSYHCTAPDDYHAINLERMLTQAVTRAKRYVSERIYLTSVGFAHQPTTGISNYEAVFGCRPSFGEECCFLCFDSQFLDFELPQRNPYLHQALSRHVETLLRKLPVRRSLTQQVAKTVEKSLPTGEVDAEKIADKLAMSRQTLYRKLKLEGTSFHDLVEEVRRNKARAYLKAGRYSLSEIAFLLGFSEQSAFSRAFKRWTGKTPAQYRRRD